MLLLLVLLVTLIAIISSSNGKILIGRGLPTAPSIYRTPVCFERTGNRLRYGPLKGTVEETVGCSTDLGRIDVPAVSIRAGV